MRIQHLIKMTTLRIPLNLFVIFGVVLISQIIYAESTHPPIYADSIIDSNKPKILENSIIFNDGSVITISNKEKRLFKNPNIALNSGNLPVSYSQEVIDVPGWKQILLLTHQNFFEGGATQISRYDYSGNLLSRRNLLGEIRVLEKAKRLLLAEISYHRNVDKTIILDEKDKIIAKLEYDNFLPRIFGLKVSQDEELIWFYSRGVKHTTNETPGPGIPYNQITVIDHDGNLVTKIKSFKDETLSIEFKKKEYKIRTGVPDFPG